MPVKKHNNRKNLPKEVRDDKVVPKTGTRGLKVGKTGATQSKRITALATVGKKKKPK